MSAETRMSLADLRAKTVASHGHLEQFRGDEFRLHLKTGYELWWYSPREYEADPQPMKYAGFWKYSPTNPKPSKV